MRGADVKKAQSSMLIKIILMLLVASLIIVVWTVFGEKSSGIAEDTACKSSVIAHSKFGTEIKCPVHVDVIKKKKADDIKRELADRMVRCFDNYGRGELKLFSAEDERFCTVCDIVTFKKQTELTSFNRFLIEHFTSYGSEKQRYIEFILNTPLNEMGDYLFYLENNDVSVDTSYKYAVLFVYLKDTDVVWSKTGIRGNTFEQRTVDILSTIGTVYSTFFTKPFRDEFAPVWGAEWSAAVVLAPYTEKNLKEFGCTQLPVGLGMRDVD